MTRNEPLVPFPLRGAIIGFGNAAVRTHLPAWSKSSHFRIDAVLDSVPERLKLAREFLPGARIYTEPENLFKDNSLDFVDICTPPSFHGDLILRACDAGLHVLCEKPLVTSMESLEEIERSTRKSKNVVFTVNNWKYAPLWIRVLELIHSMRLGILKSVFLSVLRPPEAGGGVSPWRKNALLSGGGILLDHGWHYFYLILSMTGELPLSISSRMRYTQEGDPPLEEEVDLTMRFRGVEAKLYLTWQASLRRNEGTIEGDGGTLLINDDHLILRGRGLPDIRYDFPEALSASSFHPEWMDSVIEDFHREILHEEIRGSNLNEARQCARLTHLAYQSDRAARASQKEPCFIPVGTLVI